MGKKKGVGMAARRNNEHIQQKEAKQRRVEAKDREYNTMCQQEKFVDLTQAAVPVVVVFVAVASLLGTLAQHSYTAASVVTAAAVVWLGVGMLGWRKHDSKVEEEEGSGRFMSRREFGLAGALIGFGTIVVLRIAAKIAGDHETMRCWLPPLTFTLVYIPWSLVELGLEY